MASLHIEKEFDDMLNELKTIHEMDKKKIVQLCIRYIYKNKINPENIKPNDSAAELKALRNSLVGFIKTQEKEKLDPILQKLDYVIEKLNKPVSPMVNTTSQPSDQYLKLLDIHKNMSEQYKKLVEHNNNSLPIFSKHIKENTESLRQLNETVQNKLSKKLL
ncbi:BfmA/BtgA family mobilization protein [uncultured Cytophaga sp.]|uniref:BfmA/BtgA family mobilization protein n=1 Tax=uncultured Cytophaga sp. TaxID=160238 RepID=UPI00261D1301|nr:BfmA/BtgA family mobilization protein [uncultured Cytophaga sp.]